ncbi:hypothetical protein KJ680_03080, partial [bacterium]|nr:hypothetical protein [bacterium]
MKKLTSIFLIQIFIITSLGIPYIYSYDNRNYVKKQGQNLAPESVLNRKTMLDDEKRECIIKVISEEMARIISAGN